MDLSQALGSVLYGDHTGLEGRAFLRDASKDMVIYRIHMYYRSVVCAGLANEEIWIHI
jgi:hypothetical protein